MNTSIYLDYAATTPVAPEVASCMMQYLTADGIFANPSSIQHCFGQQAEQAVENVRALMAELLHCKAKAFELANDRLNEDSQHLATLRHTFLNQLNNLEDVALNGNQESVIPNILNISFDDVSSDALIIALRDKVAISSSSACNSGTVEASYVLRAMGIEGERIYSAVRFSFGRYTTEQEIKQAGQSVSAEVICLKQLAIQ